MIRIFTWFCLLVVLASCRTEHEQAVDVALAYVEAVDVYGAPYRAFGYLASSDKLDGAEVYAKGFGGAAFEGGRVVLVKSEPTRDQTRVTVAVIGRDGQRVERDVVVIQDFDEKWRVLLNRTGRREVDRLCGQAETRIENGDFEGAHELLVPLNAKAFRGTGAHEVELRLTALGKTIDDHRRIAGLSKAFEDADALEHEALAEAIAKLAKRILPGDARFAQKLEALRQKLGAQVKALQVQELQVTRQKVRRVMRGGSLEREAIIWIRNTLDRPLGRVRVAVDYLNEPDGDPVATSTHELITRGQAALAPSEKREFVRRLKKPSGWAGRLIATRPIDFVFKEEE